MFADVKHKLSMVTLVFVIANCGCGTQKTGPSPAAQPTGQAGSTTEPKQVAQPQEKPDFVVTATELFDQYAKDEAAAKKKYDGKVVRVSGVIRHFIAGFGGRPSISLSVGKEDKFISFEMSGSDPRPWDKICPGQTVKLQGRGTANEVGVVLKNCVFTELGPNPVIRITASQLAKEYSADKEKTTQRYDKKWMIVEGEIAEIGLVQIQPFSGSTNGR